MQWVQINKHVMKRISHILKWYIIFVILPLRFFLNYIPLQRHPIYKYSAFSLRKWKRQYVSNSYLHSYCFSKRDIIHLFHNYFIQQKYSIAKAVAKKYSIAISMSVVCKYVLFLSVNYFLTYAIISNCVRACVRACET